MEFYIRWIVAAAVPHGEHRRLGSSEQPGPCKRRRKRGPAGQPVPMEIAAPRFIVLNGDNRGVSNKIPRALGGRGMFVSREFDPVPAKIVARPREALHAFRPSNSSWFGGPPHRSLGGADVTKTPRGSVPAHLEGSRKAVFSALVLERA